MVHLGTMRRSLAPSQKAFAPPKPAGTGPLSTPNTPLIVSVRPPAPPVVPVAALGLVATPETRQDERPVSAAAPALPPSKKTFSVPVQRLGVATPVRVPAGVPCVEPSPAMPPSVDGPTGSGPKYYTIMYTKFSKKKHKVYDDGILTLTGTLAVIQNMEGTHACFGAVLALSIYLICHCTVIQGRCVLLACCLGSIVGRARFCQFLCVSFV